MHGKLSKLDFLHIEHAIGTHKSLPSQVEGMKDRTKQSFDTTGYLELLKCALDGRMSYKYTVKTEDEREVNEWGFNHTGDDEKLREEILNDPGLQNRLERLTADSDEGSESVESVQKLQEDTV